MNNAIHDYITFEDLYEKAGYKVHKPKVNSFIRALMEYSKNHRSIKWVKTYLDSYFDNLRKQKKDKNKQNGIQKQNG